ncbi:MFS transporter [Isoptericola sp. NPDC019693]|uniref:MFS transporter n=1 Tax=Isoptericola sp. NPDC019693 TaxID=3364009 RepID=UPI00379C9171
MPDQLRRRLSLFSLTLLVGLGMSSWITRTPDVRDALGASTAGMGLVLFGLSVGSMTGVLSAGPIVRRRGARPVILVGSLLVVAGVAVIGLAASAGLAAGAFAGLLLVGLGGGLGEIGLNIEGAAVEVETGQQVLPALHGSFSLGTVVGALVGIALTALDFPVVWHLLAMAAVMAALIAWAMPGIPAGTGRRERVARETGEAGAPHERRPSVWRDGRLVLIGVVVLAMAFAEGAANDWLPLLMVDGHGMSATHGSLVYAGFAAAMTVGRFAGGPVVERFGRAAVLSVSAVCAIAGILAVVFAPSPVVAGIAVALWGLGASLGFPVAISAAGDDPERGGERVSAVATSGYLAFLVGPPLLGFLGEHLGLRLAMLAVVVLLVVAVFAARAAAPRPLSLPERPAPQPARRR